MLRTLLVAFFAIPLLVVGQTSAVAFLAQARDAYAATNYEVALNFADSALFKNNELPGAHKLRGDIKQRMSDMHGALLDYVKAEKLDDTDPRLFVSRSAVHITEGRLKEAMRDINKALDLNPKEADAWYNSACANYLAQNNDGALDDLERALELKPDGADALFLRGVIKGELYKEADGLADIEAALALKPTILGGKMSAAVLLYEMKRYDEAIERLTDIIATDTTLTSEAHYYRAECYYSLDNKDKACSDWRVSGEMGDPQAQYIVRNYCLTDEKKIPKKPKKERKTVIEF